MSSMTTGIVLTMIAGLMSGNCMLPMKFARRWRWENIWLVFSVVSLLVLPWVLALAIVHRLFDVYRTVPPGVSFLAFFLNWDLHQKTLLMS